MPVASLHVLLLYNAPSLAKDHLDFASEAGVLESVTAISVALQAVGFRVSELAVDGSVAKLVEQLNSLRPDVVVNLCESFASRSAGEPHVAALLELLGLPYTGSPSECLALAHDKPRTKRLLVGAGMPTADYVEVCSGNLLPEVALREMLATGPLIVKPAREDASLGIGPESVVVDWPALTQQVDNIQKRYGDVLIERYVAGREFNVGIIELSDLQVLPLAEIEFQKNAPLPWPIITYAGKWKTQSTDDLATPVCCPAAVEPELAQRIQAAALAAYRILACRDYARIDLRVDHNGQPFLLEVNANPDIGPQAGLARMLHAAGISYDEFARRLVERAEGRKRNTNEASTVNRLAASRQASNDASAVRIRELKPDDVDRLLELTRSCGVFRPDEIEIAAEVLRDAVRDGVGGHYQVLVAELNGRAVGWSCHGRVPLTDATFDLYWIAVDPQQQRSGIGRILLSEVERQIVAIGGRWLLAETSSTDIYRATREFYLRCGFHVVSQIDDFYRAGDGKTTFGKRLDQP